MEISEKEWIELKGDIAICKHENAAMKEIMKQEEKNERLLIVHTEECRREMRMVIALVVLAPIIGEVLVTLIKIFAISI